VQDVWESLKAFLLALGDDVQMKELEQYVAFRRLKNFACVRQRSKDLQVWARLDPTSVLLEEGFHARRESDRPSGNGDLEIRIQNAADLERARPLLLAKLSGSLTGRTTSMRLPRVHPAWTCFIQQPVNGEEARPRSPLFGFGPLRTWPRPPGRCAFPGITGMGPAKSR